MLFRPTRFMPQEHIGTRFSLLSIYTQKINAHVIFYNLKIVIMAFLVFHVLQSSVFKGSSEHIHHQEALMAEKDIVRQILRYLKTVPGCFAWKEHGGMVRPDRALSEVV